jgi:GR25 family glycosyltransferase involved in LPS biosynthesis
MRTRRCVRGGFDAVFVINLRRRADRMAAMLRQLAACGYRPDDITRYEAVEGAALRTPALRRAGFLSKLAMKRLARPEHERVWGMDLNPGAVGCALSHVDLWAQISARELERVLVLEDDCLIPPTFVADFERSWRRVEDHPVVAASWGLVYVSGLDTEQRGHLLEVSPGLRLVPRMHRTTNAYVINARGARALLHACVPFTFQLDTAMTTTLSSDVGNGEHAVTAVPCFSLHPSLIVQGTRFGSDIQAASGNDVAEEERGRCAAAGWSQPPLVV